MYKMSHIYTITTGGLRHVYGKLTLAHLSPNQATDYFAHYFNTNPSPSFLQSVKPCQRKNSWATMQLHK